MPKKTNRLPFLILFLFVVFFGLIQVWDFLVFGINPNWTLVAVITVSFFVRDVWEGLLLVASGALILKFGSGFQKEILIFSLLSAVAVILKKYLPFFGFLNNLFWIAATTFAFYLFFGTDLIWSVVFVKELFLNLIIGMAFFALLSVVSQSKGLAQKNPGQKRKAFR